MFAPSYWSQPHLQSGVELHLRPEDTLTELCHAAEVYVPHELNKEYRLKRTFVDVGGDPRTSGAIPKLSAHQYVQAREQALKVSSASKKPIQMCRPIEAVGFADLKKRFDQQQDALKKQEEAIHQVSDRLEREENLYRTNMEDRQTRVERSQRKLKSNLIKLFCGLDESRIAAAAERGNSFQVSSYTGTARDQVDTVKERARLENLKNRVLHVEKTAHLLDRQRRKVKRDRDEPAADPDTDEEMVHSVKRTTLRVHQTRVRISNCTRDVRILTSTHHASE